MSDMSTPEKFSAQVQENRRAAHEVKEHEIHERLFGVTIERGEAKFAVSVDASKIDGTCTLHFECEWSEPALNPDEAEIMADALRAAIFLMRA
jgi:hypothetical protein